MVSCKKCGGLNSEGSMFCGVCGASLNENNAATNNVNNINAVNTNINVDTNTISNQISTDMSAEKYTVGGAIGKACAWFFGAIGVFFIIMIIRAVMNLIGSQDYNYKPELLDRVLAFIQILTPLVMVFVIAPIKLIKGIIKANNQENYVNSTNNNQVFSNSFINNDNISLDDKLLMAYIGNNYSKIMQKGFNISALFFSWIYILYRKVYITSIVGMIIVDILRFLPDIISVIVVISFCIVLGINFNKWYITYAQKKINKIKVNNQNVSDEELIDLCQKTGGTNIWLALLIYIGMSIVSTLLFKI